MDAQYPFASRDDIWRVCEQLKDLQVTQFDQGERIAKLERRRDEDARLKSVWSPTPPFPSSMATSLPAESVFHPPADAFKGFDQVQSGGIMGIEGDDEPRRGTSRANSVRFDESANYGYYGQVSRSSSEFPLRTGSGLGSHPLMERSLSHRSDGRLSSSGHSHHSARANSLGLENSRGMNAAESPLTPPPGLFILGPLPCIIRCWLTSNFSNDSLLYAAVCSGSCTSSLGFPVIRKLGLEGLVTQEAGMRFIKIALYLPEASIRHASPRSSSPAPQVPVLSIRFTVYDVDPDDQSIQIILGSDVLRSHNADVLFSQDKIIMVDDERNKISIPLVRPENDATYKNLRTGSDACLGSERNHPTVNGHAGVIGQPVATNQAASALASSRTPVIDDLKLELQENEKPQDLEPADFQPLSVGVWGSWRRDSRLDHSASAGRATRGRAMKVLRPTKSSSRVNSTAPGNVTAGPRDQSSRPSNPVGGASAFGWLNSQPQR